MARSDRMAALKAARKAKMEARRARMADKKAKKTRPKTAADKAFKDTFKKSGGMAAMAARKKARKAAAAKAKAPKTEKMNATTAATGNAAPNNTGKNFRTFNAGTGTKGTKPPKKIITPRDTPKRKILDAKIADADRMVDKDQKINASINKFGEKIKNAVTGYMDKTGKKLPGYKEKQAERLRKAREKAKKNMKGQNNSISSFMKSLVAKDPVEVKDNVKRKPSNTGRYGAGINNKPRDLGADKMKKGGSVKKNMGGKIRGYGMARGGKVVKSS